MRHLVLCWSLSISACLVIGCTPTPDVPKSEPSCAGACTQLDRLACPEGETTDAGVTCQQWCERYHAAGFMRPFAECVAASTDVEAVRACNVRCAEVE